MSGPHGWYLAAVQAKVWTIWASQAPTHLRTVVEVQFTILENGSLGELRIVTTSGNTLLDMAAARAIESAAPFAPLPVEMEARPLTVQARFDPER